MTNDHRQQRSHEDRHCNPLDEPPGLWEVQRYGRDSFGNEDYVSRYGMRPTEWYNRQVRILGRTAVECTHDELAQPIAKDVVALAARAPGCSGTLVIDLFVGPRQHPVLDLARPTGRPRTRFRVGRSRLRLDAAERRGAEPVNRHPQHRLPLGPGGRIGNIRRAPHRLYRPALG
jgi:hypothetical protein